MTKHLIFAQNKNSCQEKLVTVQIFSNKASAASLVCFSLLSCTSAPMRMK